MKKIYLFILTGLLCFTISQVGQAQPADLVLSSPESGTKLHQATNSITFAPGYSYTPNGGTLTAEIVQEPIPGDDLTNPIVVGQFNSDFQYTDSQNTNNFTDQYVGRPTNDVFYRFTLTREMLVIMTHCGSALSDTYMHLLDASGNLIVSNDDYGGDGSCSFQLHSFIQRQLSAGTYYVVSEGYSQNGVIQTNITGYSNEFDYPVQPSPYSPDPAPVGAVDGLFSVSGTGAATYSIPVDAPPGVGGMSPQLSVVYNSQSVNGVTGWGSNLAGISVINRIPKSIYFDGTAKALTYLGDEAYLLDGQRLIYTSGTPGQEGAIYYPESDPFTKVLVHGTYSGTTCNTWFEVISKDGIKYTYGNTSDSRQTFAGGKVASWYLNHVEDPLGNYMDYNYMISSYYLYLNSVVYGKNKNESSTLENRIEMSYESRPDPVFFVLETTKGGIYQRLAKITSKTGTSVFREYVLTYANSDLFSRLASVTEKNGAGESLKPTQLYWNYLAAFSQQCYLPTVNPAIVFPTVPFADQSFTSADLNGDGLADLISVFPIDIPMGGGTIRHTNYAYIYWASLDTNGNPQFLTGNYFDIGPTFSFSGWTEQKGGCTPIDFDGDGIQEIVIPHLSISELGNFVEFKFFNGALSTRAFGYSLQYSEEMPVYATGDFNNDGKGDIISIEKGNSNNRYPCMMAGFNQGTTLYQGSFNLTLPEKPEKMFASDFNNDGLTDVMVFYEGGYSIFWNQGYGISNQTLSDNKKTTGTTIENNRMVRMGDFDGDGLSDFILNGTDSSSNWYFALSNGNGTFSKFLACTLDEGFLLRDKDRLDCKVYDFDLDGKSDVVIHRAVYLIIPFSQTRTSWMRSTGTSLTLVAAASSDNRDDAYSKYLVTGDFNGDGKTELMNYGYNCYDGSSTTQTWRYYRNSGITAGSGMLASVTDGYGSTTSMTYSPLTGSIYTKGTGAQYPVIDLTPPVAAVKQVVYDNGVAGSMTENYSYAGAKVHLQGKGLLGFMSRTVNNITTSVSMETGTKSLNLTWFTPSETYSKTTVDGQTAETSVKYTFTDKGAKKYFAYPNMKVEKDLDSNVDTTTYQYNTTYGYLTDEKTEYGGSAMYRAMQYRNYILAGGCYQPQLITAVQKHTDDNQVFSQSTSLTYNTTKGYPVTKVENQGTSLALTAEFTVYDNFGNLEEYQVSGLGVPAITYHTDYDATGRFIAGSSTTPASSVISYLYDTWGNVISETDETNPSNPLVTSHTYDGWGQETATTLPDGRKIAWHTGWNNNNVSKRYFVLAQGSGKPWVKQWYDRTGRETVTETIGPKDINLITNKTYNSKGELSGTQIQQESLTLTESFTYDGRGRLQVHNTASGQIFSYSYGNRTVTTTTNGNSYTKTFDAWGDIKSSTDPLSNVTYTYKSVGKPWMVSTGGVTFTMDYDAAGNQKLLSDPNTGTINYTYDAAGRVNTQDDARGNHFEAVYDALGRMDHSTLAGVQTDYTYGTTGYDVNRLTKIQTGNNYISYSYDQYGRTQSEERQIEGDGLVEFDFVYNPNGQLQTTSYPSSVQVNNEYDAYGNLVKVMAGSQAVWELTGATGTMTTTQLSTTMTATSTLNAQGLLTNLKTMRGSTVIRDMGYGFDGATGNLSWRTGMIGQQESFYYDQLNRLLSVEEGTPGVETMEIGYAANGSISRKTGLGNYSYLSTKPHAVSAVENTGGLVSIKEQYIGYTTFNKMSFVEETVGTDAYRLDIMYGPDQQRWKSVLKKNGIDVKTIIFGGDYEKVSQNGVTRELYYIAGGDGLAAVYVKQAGQSDQLYYAHTDHLGSIVSLTDANGTAVFRGTYDAWGRQTVSLNTIGLHRGYTGHEHLPEFGLINMNGRMYDPVLGRFLSPDNLVQVPDFSQSFNRYSYCLNNPMVYTDPSGEFFWIFPVISWSPHGGLSISLSAGIGLPGILSIGGTVSFGANSFSVTASVSFGGVYAYAGYASGAGAIAGAGFGFGGIGLGNGFSLSSNVTNAGINWSQNGGWSSSMFGFNVSTSGVQFDPGVGIGYRMEYYAKPSISEISTAGMGVVARELAEIGTNAQKDALLKSKGVNLADFYVDKVDLENTVFPKTADDDKINNYQRGEDGIIINPKGEKVGGVTFSGAGWDPKISSIYMSPFNSARNFIIALNHEFIHAWQWANFRTKMTKTEWNAFKEPAAYGYTSMYFPDVLHSGATMYFGPYRSWLRSWPANLIKVPQ